MLQFKHQPSSPLSPSCSCSQRQINLSEFIYLTNVNDIGITGQPTGACMQQRHCMADIPLQECGSRLISVLRSLFLYLDRFVKKFLPKPKSSSKSLKQGLPVIAIQTDGQFLPMGQTFSENFQVVEVKFKRCSRQFLFCIPLEPLMLEQVLGSDPQGRIFAS